MSNGKFYLFRKTADSKPVVLTAAGKKEFERSGNKASMKFIGECNEEGILLSAIKTETPVVNTPGVSAAEQDDATKTVKEIVETPVTKDSDIAKETSAKTEIPVAETPVVNTPGDQDVAVSDYDKIIEIESADPDQK